MTDKADLAIKAARAIEGLKGDKVKAYNIRRYTVDGAETVEITVTVDQAIKPGEYHNRRS